LIWVLPGDWQMLPAFVVVHDGAVVSAARAVGAATIAAATPPAVRMPAVRLRVM
jgi:hypothetical protein